MSFNPLMVFFDTETNITGLPWYQIGNSITTDLGFNILTELNPGEFNKG